jgi:putative ABC transport system permease protein
LAACEGAQVTYIGLLVHNVWRRRVRAIVTVVAVAIGVTAVLALGVLTSSLRETAVSVLKLGRADFSVSQEGASDVLYSTMSKEELDAIRRTEGVESAIGTFVRTGHLSKNHPFFIEIGLAPSDLRDYGVQVVAGRSYGANARDEMMLGWRAAKDFGVRVGDRFDVEERTFRVVGIFSTNNPIGDAGGMYPIGPLQDWHTLPGVYTLGFVRVEPGASVEAVRKAVERANPRLATIRSESDFGRVDRNLVLITAANVGGSILALFIGATGVMNTSLLSFYERIREFGLLRATGWNRRRMFGLVLGEALLVSLVGAALGIGVGIAAVVALTQVSSLAGVFHPSYDASIFGRALSFAFAMAVLGALYPAVQAARLAPRVAMQHE